MNACEQHSIAGAGDAPVQILLHARSARQGRDDQKNKA
jgi:hypothetical protein